MPKRPVIRDERAVSPVIATIIIVAVAIVMAIAVAYWALGLAGTFTRFEKLEITAMYAGHSRGYWNITVTLRSTGTATATINMILLNGKPLKDYYLPTTPPKPAKVYNVTGTTPEDITGQLASGISLPPGTTRTYRIDVADAFFAPGVSVEVVFHTAAGSDYPKVVVLP